MFPSSRPSCSWLACLNGTDCQLRLSRCFRIRVRWLPQRSQVPPSRVGIHRVTRGGPLPVGRGSTPPRLVNPTKPSKGFLSPREDSALLSTVLQLSGPEDMKPQDNSVEKGVGVLHYAPATNLISPPHSPGLPCCRPPPHVPSQCLRLPSRLLCGSLRFPPVRPRHGRSHARLCGSDPERGPPSLQIPSR